MTRSYDRDGNDLRKKQLMDSKVNIKPESLSQA